MSPSASCRSRPSQNNREPNGTSGIYPSGGTGKNYARYSNIQIDGVNAALGTPETDNASISISTNNATITVDSALY